MHQVIKRVSFLVIILFTLVSQSETRTSIDVQGLSFISPDFDDPQKSTFGFVGATLKTSSQKTQLFNANLQGTYAVGNSSLSYLNIREVYFSFQLEEEKVSTFHFGRKLHAWSSMDEAWNLGFFQPQFRWNTLNPENQGLTGLFWDRQESLWGLTLFASSIFIPDQGASYEVKDGKFEDSNPWFSAPPQNIKFQGQILPIDYNLEKPEISEVVFRPLFAAQLRLGKPQQGFFADLAGAFKPSHQFAIGYSGVLVTNRVRIDVQPEVYMENIYSADLGYRDSWGLAQFSVLYTAPQNPTFETSQNTPEFEPSLSFSPRFQYKLNPFDFELSYLDTQGGVVTEKGPDTSADRVSLSQRFLFRQALQAQISFAKVLMKSFKWDSQFQFRHSEKDEFQQIRFKNRINLKGPWAFWSDLILIETGDDANLNMNTYRNLDQFWIGASYDL